MVEVQVCFEHCCGARSRRAGSAAALGNAADGFMDSDAWAAIDYCRREERPAKSRKERGEKE